jgi:hypothetical protein
LQVESGVHHWVGFPARVARRPGQSARPPTGHEHSASVSFRHENAGPAPARFSGIPPRSAWCW